MSQTDLARAHAALQGLKADPVVLSQFHAALSSLSASTGLALEDPTLTYVANTLINQRLSLANTALGNKKGTKTVSGFHIAAAIKVEPTT